MFTERLTEHMQYNLTEYDMTIIA